MEITQSYQVQQYMTSFIHPQEDLNSAELLLRADTTEKPAGKTLCVSSFAPTTKKVTFRHVDAIRLASEAVPAPLHQQKYTQSSTPEVRTAGAP